MVFDPIAYINEPRWMSSRLGLERIRELLERLGRPQDQLKFVHVAGTNGKGSTCSYLASILQAAGYRTGLFTSPFIETFEERIRVEGRNISLGELTEVTLVVREQAEAMSDHPTEFELMTAVALVHFARSACDVVVLEVGLGGRLDSTNAIDAPEVAVIARIGLDHTALLGNTLAAIAGEKTGIIKHGAPVVSWPQEPEAMAIVEQVSRAHEAVLTSPDFAQLEIGSVLTTGHRGSQETSERALSQESAEHPGAQETSENPAVQEAAEYPAAQKCSSDQPYAQGSLASETFGSVRTFSYKGYRELTTRLLGSYQPQNAALAIETIEALCCRGWRVSDTALRQGIAEAKWPGRFEIVDSGMGRATFVVDGGHNPQGARALAASLVEVFPHVKPVFIMGVLEDKNYPEMLEAILPLGSAFITVTPDNPRALSADKLARAIRWTDQDMLGCSACVKPIVARTMEDAVAKARELAGSDGLVCAFGSLYSIAALKAAL